MYFSDTLTNLITGLGTERDKAAGTTFAQLYLSKMDCDSAYTSDWLAGTIIDAPCDDMTREWRIWNAGKLQTKLMQQEEHRLGVRETVNRAMKMARLYGGSAILIGTGDKDPSKPLNLNTVHRGGLKYIHALSRWELWTGQLDRDPMSPHFGEPLWYELATPLDDAQSTPVATAGVRIHPSRIVRFLGQAKLELSWAVDGWGLSTLQRVYDAVKNAGAAAQNLASLTHEAKVDVISIPDLTKNSLNPTWRAQMLARMSLANMAKSNQSMLLLDAAEIYAQKKISLGDMPKVITTFLEIAAGAANIPLTRLLGKSPSGLSATGDTEIRHYYDTLSGRQHVELGPVLSRLDEVLIRSALGTRPAALHYRWNPLWQPTEAETSAIALQNAQMVQIIAQMGVLPPSAAQKSIQQMLIAGKIFPGLEQALSEATDKPAPLIQMAQEINKPPAKAVVSKD